MDLGDEAAVAAEDAQDQLLGALDFNTAAGNWVARRRFKKSLSGIINVRSDGARFYAFRRTSTRYQWEHYGPIEPVE